MKKAEAISILATSVRPREAKDRARYDEAVKMAIEALKRSETPNSSTDCISRQAAIDTITAYPHGDVWNVENMENMVYEIKNLPSAQPERIIHCKDCEWWTKQECSPQGRCALSGMYPTGGWFCGNARRREVTE